MIFIKNKSAVINIQNVDNFDREEAGQKVYAVFQSESFDELKSNITSLLEYIENNTRHKRWICNQVTDSMLRYCFPYLSNLFLPDKNFVIIPPGHSLIFFMSSCVPYSKSPTLVIAGLHKFIERCCEFSDPIEAAVTEDEIRAVLEVAQKEYHILDIVAPRKPLKILQFDYSHSILNSECGISDGNETEAVIFVYHPRSVTIHDRVFIFAHEVAHALHLALTKDMTIVPYMFDEFNKALGVNPTSIEEKQEAFADAAAIAILSGNGLDNHLPKGFDKEFSHHFIKYIKLITDKYLSLQI